MFKLNLIQPSSSSMVTGSFLWTSSSTCTTIGATGLHSTFLWSINSPFKVTLVLTSGSTCWQGSHIIYCHMNKCSHPCWNITCSDWYFTFQTLASSYTDFYPESTFSDSDFTTSDQNIFPTLFVQVLFLPSQLGRARLVCVFQVCCSWHQRAGQLYWAFWQHLARI